LRLRAAGALSNEADLDWSNIAEEIDSLARSDRRELKNRVRTIMEQACGHLRDPCRPGQDSSLRVFQPAVAGTFSAGAFSTWVSRCLM
jgi:hypothetical protein